MVLAPTKLPVTWHHLHFLELVLSGNQNQHPISTILVFLSWYWYFRIRNLCVYVCAKSCLTLCNPMDYSPPGSSVHGIFQAGILEWVTISFSKEPSWPRGRTCISSVGRQVLYPWATWESPGSSDGCTELWCVYWNWNVHIKNDKFCVICILPFFLMVENENRMKTNSASNPSA